MSRLWYRFCRLVCRVFVLTMFRFNRRGTEHVPTAGPVLLASNHQSHLDPVLVGVACPRPINALARRTLFVGPFGWLLRSVNAVPLDREGSAVAGLKATLRLLKDGEVVLVFPEGTRTKDGSLGPMMAGFCALARRSKATIVPTAIDGSFAAMPRGCKFPKPGKIRLSFLEPLAPGDYGPLGDEELVELIRARIAAAIDAPA